MLICKYCNASKPPSETFYRKNRKGVFSATAICVDCHRLRRKRYFNKARDVQIVKMRERHALRVAKAGGRVRQRGETKWGSIREFLAWLKGAIPCHDCSRVFHFACMDFDHVRGEKFFNIAAVMGTRLDEDTLWSEIEKCELVCSNCHRIRTFNRRHA